LDWLYNKPGTIRQYLDRYLDLYNALVSVFGAIVNNESQPSPSISSKIYAQAADRQLNNKLQGATILTSSLCSDTLLSTYATPGTILYALLSTNATPDTNPYTLPLPQSSPCQRRRYDIATPGLSETDNNQEEQGRPQHGYLKTSIATQQNNILPPNIPSYYTQTFNIISTVYSLQLTPAKIITVLQTGNKLICKDAFIFLKDLLPLWKGI
jgi:hypothetical protein